MFVQKLFVHCINYCNWRDTFVKWMVAEIGGKLTTKYMAVLSKFLEFVQRVIVSFGNLQML